MTNLWVSGDVTTEENGVANINFPLVAGDYYVKMTSNTTRPIFRIRYGRAGVTSTLVFCNFNSPGGYFQTVTTEENMTYIRFQSGTTGSDAAAGGVTTISDIIIAKRVPFNVVLPADFTCYPNSPYAEDNVVVANTGDFKAEEIIITGVDTGNIISVTKRSDNTWSFIMPYEDVTVTVNYVRYAIIELIQAIGGTVTADKTIAYDGDTVTLTMTPDENYEPQSVKVTKDARDVTTTKVNDTTYTFVVHVQ